MVDFSHIKKTKRQSWARTNYDELFKNNFNYKEQIYRYTISEDGEMWRRVGENSLFSGTLIDLVHFSKCPPKNAIKTYIAYLAFETSCKRRGARDCRPRPCQLVGRFPRNFSLTARSLLSIIEF